MEALAQSQADAQANASTVADTAAPEVTDTNGKTKAEDDEDTAAPPSFAFISQSLAAAMAGAQTPAPTQPTVTTASAEDESADVMSSTTGSAGRALIASLTNSADDLKATPQAARDPKSDPSTTPTPAADNSSQTAATAFQAHMSVGAHLQHPAANGATIGRVDAPVGTAAFDEELGGKITWMANQGLQSASLQLSPEHLGPVDVRISVQDGSATVSFNAMHADTRAALEQALPRLREMFATHGLTLTDASVSQQSPRGQAQKQTVAAIGAAGRESDEPNSATVASVASARLGLVDTYA
jgi:flagellar hook-length control protein FliK